MVIIYHSLITLERINQKLVFNYLFRSEENLAINFLVNEEIDFLNQFCNFSRLPSEKTNKKQIKKLIKNSRNYLITDFLWSSNIISYTLKQWLYTDDEEIISLISTS